MAAQAFPHVGAIARPLTPNPSCCAAAQHKQTRRVGSAQLLWGLDDKAIEHDFVQIAAHEDARGALGEG